MIPTSRTSLHGRQGTHEMQTRTFCLLLLYALVGASPALAANGQGQENGSSLVWIILLLPAVLILLCLIPLSRAGRKQRKLVETEVQRTDEERQRAAVHRDHMEARMDRLDEKLTR